MSKKLDQDKYLEKQKKKDEKEKAEEQMIYGDGPSLSEIEKKKKEYKEKMLNE